jgi:hypothetical protein
MHVGRIVPRHGRGRPLGMVDHRAALLIRRPLGVGLYWIGIFSPQMGPPLAFESGFPSLGVEGANCETRNPTLVFEDESEVGFEAEVGGGIDVTYQRTVFIEVGRVGSGRTGGQRDGVQRR